MRTENTRADGAPSGSPHFVTTQWQVVLTAASSGHEQLPALEELCRVYWYPLYAYIRRHGYGPEEAKDLTQEFFGRLLQKNWLAGIQPQGGRFRAFLLTALRRFLVNEYERRTAVKRGGDQVFISIDQQEAETRYRLEPVTHETPEQVFDRRWALTVLDRALQRLQLEMSGAGKTKQMELLSPFLSREATAGEYAELGQLLNLSPGTVGVSVHRLRQRYRDLVRREITETLLDPTQAEEELHHLLEALRS